MVPHSRFSNFVLRVTLGVLSHYQVKSFIFLLHQISTSVLLNPMCATEMPTAQTVTVPITVHVNKDILEMEASVKVLSMR